MSFFNDDLFDFGMSPKKKNGNGNGNGNGKKRLRSTNFEPHDLGGAFDGRFSRIGEGFLESVPRGGTIDFDKGARRGEPISPVFGVQDRGFTLTDVGFNIVDPIKANRRIPLERVARKEATQLRREKVREEKRRRREEAQEKRDIASGRIPERRTETVGGILARKFKEKVTKKKNGNGFRSTSVDTGRGIGRITPRRVARDRDDDFG